MKKITTIELEQSDENIEKKNIGDGNKNDR